MYLAHWNLREAPFQNLPDIRFTYLCEQHHEGLARLIYVAQHKKLGGILTGPYGIGKSMVLEMLAREIAKNTTSTYVALDYAQCDAMTLAQQILSALELNSELHRVNTVIDALALLRQRKSGLKHTVLAIDESQMITDPETCHFLQSLTNITLLDRKAQPIAPAFTLILAGYIDSKHALLQKTSLTQRLQLMWRLEPLNSQQVVEYVQHRVRVAGGDIWLFDAEALAELTTAKGIPRVINNICDTALMLGYAANVRQVNRAIMQQAILESDRN